MKKITLIAGLICAFSGFGNAQDLAFHKGSFQINVTEGTTYGNYGTQYVGGEAVGFGHIVGCRDPFQLEYGISNKWGIGISSGADYYYLNPTQFYGFNVSNNQIKAFTTEFTIDGSYHFLVTRKLDIAAVLSYGSSGVSFKGTDAGDNAYSYTSTGGMLRLGIHGRFYFGHFGIVAMGSVFSESSSPVVAKGEVGNHYSTSISGFAKEFGICYRFKK
ncbi:MAG TPA: hypothetical protein VNY36_04225 [Bacteroidia bacterium]|jgi:hypothetical protein|nr:hypothetical protein [Bacteroidia bacterium]